jgi:hypothetical protein
MLEALIPREKLFFELFAKAAKKGEETCGEFEAMLGDMGHAENHARRIKTFEHEADEITHRTVETIHRTFVTPLDRDDIHRLISRLDDVIDLVEAASDRVFLYEIVEATDEAKDLARVLSAASKQIAVALSALERAKKRPEIVLEACIEINRLENEGDAILRRAIARLFREEQDLRLVMKWKEIYETLEAAIDRCEDVANIVEGIVLEQG